MKCDDLDNVPTVSYFWRQLSLSGQIVHSELLAKKPAGSIVNAEVNISRHIEVAATVTFRFESDTATEVRCIEI